MPGIAGRLYIVRKDGVALAGVRSKSLSINGSPIDVTTDDEAGVRALLDVPGQVDVSMSVSGLAANTAAFNTLRDLALSTTDRVVTLEFDTGSGSPQLGFRGSFFLEGFTEGGETQGPGTFEVTFQSTGAVTRLPG